MRKTAVVHIGLEKTGSTAIQRWLASGHDRLAGHGVVMPRSIGFPNHTKLVSACLDDGVYDNIKSHQLFVAAVSEQRFRRQVFAALDHEVRAAGDAWRTLLISSELISSRLSTPSEIGRLHEQLLRHVDAVRYVLFLRRQDQLALSRFSSILRSGHRHFSDVFLDYSPSNFLKVPDQRCLSDDLFFYDSEAIISRFEGLPSAEVDVHFYGRSSPVEVMSALLGLEGFPAVEGKKRHNSALSAEAQYILSRLNRIRPVQFPSGMRNDAYRGLQRRVEAEVGGPPRMVRRADAEAFHDRFAAMNARLFKRYGDGAPCFSQDFGMYPEACDYSKLPEQASASLAKYERLARALPDHPSSRQLLKSKSKRFKALLRSLVGRVVR